MQTDGYYVHNIIMKTEMQIRNFDRKLDRAPLEFSPPWRDCYQQTLEELRIVMGLAHSYS